MTCLLARRYLTAGDRACAIGVAGLLEESDNSRCGLIPTFTASHSAWG